MAARSHGFWFLFFLVVGNEEVSLGDTTIVFKYDKIVRVYIRIGPIHQSPEKME